MQNVKTAELLTLGLRTIYNCARFHEDLKGIQIQFQTYMAQSH